MVRDVEAYKAEAERVSAFALTFQLLWLTRPGRRERSLGINNMISEPEPVAVSGGRVELSLAHGWVASACTDLLLSLPDTISDPGS